MGKSRTKNFRESTRTWSDIRSSLGERSEGELFKFKIYQKEMDRILSEMQRRLYYIEDNNKADGYNKLLIDIYNKSKIDFSKNLIKRAKMVAERLRFEDLSQSCDELMDIMFSQTRTNYETDRTDY